MSTPAQRIAARMKQRRLELGLSQEETGRRLGTTLRTYARWERGETNGHMRELGDIARALETSESELLGGEDALSAQPTVDDLAAKLDAVACEVHALREDLAPLVALAAALRDSAAHNPAHGGNEESNGKPTSS